jgi:hypothetical protein
MLLEACADCVSVMVDLIEMIPDLQKVATVGRCDYRHSDGKFASPC